MSHIRSPKIKSEDTPATGTNQNLPVLPWRLEKGAMIASETALIGAIHRCETAELWCALAVAVGLGIEVAIAIVNPSYNSFWERFGPVLSDALVFVGVLGEYAANNRSQTCQGELTRRSNKRLAKAELEAAEARARTAEVEKLTAWRRISPEQLDHFVKVIGPIADQIRLWVEYQNGDIEAFRFGQDVARAFQKAGVSEIGWRGNSFIPDTPYGLNMSVDGPDAALLENAISGFEPLITVNTASLSAKLTDGKIRPNVYVFVGPRVPPEMFGDDAPVPLPLGAD